MSKFGTCKHAWQIQVKYRFSHEDLDRLMDGGSPERHRVVDTSDDYTCQFLAVIGDLPPPIRRQHGGFDIRREDCDNCPRYEAPEINLVPKEEK